MRTSIILFITTACVIYVTCHPFETTSVPKGLTKSSFLLISKSPSKSHDATTSLKADQDEGSIVSFLTLLLLSSIPDSKEEIHDKKPIVTPVQNQRKPKSAIKFEGFDDNLPVSIAKSTESKEEILDDQQILLAMALQRLFSDSSMSEELEEKILARLSGLKSSLMTDPASFERSQETLTKLIQPRKAESLSTEVKEKDIPVCHDEYGVRGLTVSSEEDENLDTFAYRDEYGRRLDKTSSEEDENLDTFVYCDNYGQKISSEEDEDLDTFAYRDEYGRRLHKTISVEDEDLDTFAYRDEYGRRYKTSSEENEDLYTFAYRDDCGHKPSSEEDKDLDTFTYRDEYGRKLHKSSSEEDEDLDTFAHRDEQGIRFFKISSEENAVLDTLAYRDSFGVRRFKISSGEDSDTFAHRYERDVRKYNHSSEEDDDLDTFTLRDDCGHIISWFPGF